MEWHVQSEVACANQLRNQLIKIAMVLLKDYKVSILCLFNLYNYFLYKMGQNCLYIQYYKTGQNFLAILFIQNFKSYSLGSLRCHGSTRRLSRSQAGPSTPPQASRLVSSTGPGIMRRFSRYKIENRYRCILYIDNGLVPNSVYFVYGRKQYCLCIKFFF